MAATSEAETSSVDHIYITLAEDPKIDYFSAEDLGAMPAELRRRSPSASELNCNFIPISDYGNTAKNLQTQPNNVAALTSAGATTSFVKNIYSVFIKDEKMDGPICVFKVPSSLASSKPEAYVPQLVGLGPYHHLRPELQQMQMCKLSEVKKIGKGFKGFEFEVLVLVLKEIAAPSVRACYGTYLDMDDEVLACIIAIDGLFLFELLCCYGIRREALGQLDLLRDLVNSVGRRLARDSTLGDAMMLENQLPILVLKVILIALEMMASEEKEEVEPLSLIVSDPFPQMLLGFCKALSPLKVLIDYPHYKALKHSHLLDLMYHLIILNNSPKKSPDEEEEEALFIVEKSEKIKIKISELRATSQFVTDISSDGDLRVGASNILPQELEKPFELLQGLRGLPWSQLWSTIYSAAPEGPQIEEILIPRASELHKAGVKFTVADHITAIGFDLKTRSFYLPLIKLDVYSEVIIRNLAAYEAMIKSQSDSLILTRYVELMKGLVENAEDVRVLKGVIESKFIKEDEVAVLFTGMSKSTRSTNTPRLDKAIAEVNQYYNGLWRVSAAKFIRKWWRTAWNLAKVFGALLVILFMAIQAFCSVYECPRLSFKNNNSPALQGMRVFFSRSPM